MNALVVGKNKSQLLQFVPNDNFLVIDDGPFIKRLDASSRPYRKFEPESDSFNPLKDIAEEGAEELAEIIYAAFPYGQDTLTVRNGKRALKKLVCSGTRLDKLSYSEDDNDLEAMAAVNDTLFSPTRRQFFCGTSNFSLTGTVVAELDRAKLSDRTCFVIACILIANFNGTIIIPDFGFYGRSFHSYLMRQQRLVAGLNYLDESPLKNELLLIQNKGASQCLYRDAITLAEYAGLHPDPTRIDNPFNRYIAQCLQ